LREGGVEMAMGGLDKRKKIEKFCEVREEEILAYFA